jgi:hypothetical protein
MSKNDYLRLSPDKSFCMEQMMESLKNTPSEGSWQSTQYLWPLHPIFDWINEKASLLYPRGDAPLIGIEGKFPKGESAYVLSGIIPNRNSAPVVDIIFSLHYSAKGDFLGKWNMNELLDKTGFREKNTPNKLKVKETDISANTYLLPDVINQAKKIMSTHSSEYKKRIDPLINKEIENLGNLQKRRIEVIKNLCLEASEKKKKEDEVEKLFNQFVNFVHDSLEIVDTPYLRILACIKGV